MFYKNINIKKRKRKMKTYMLKMPGQLAEKK